MSDHKRKFDNEYNQNDDTQIAKIAKFDSEIPKEDVITIPKSKLECSLCTDMLTYPMRFDCGCVFCLRCVVKHKASSLILKPHGEKSYRIYPSVLKFKKDKCPQCSIILQPSKGCSIGEAIARPVDKCLMELLHQEDKMHSCETCTSSFTLLQYPSHVLKCSRISNLKCPECDILLKTPPSIYISTEQKKDQTINLDELQKMWHYHLDTECTRIICNQCNWDGSHADWSTHLLQHNIEQRLVRIGQSFSGRESSLWSKWIQETIERMPIERLRILYSYEDE